MVLSLAVGMLALPAADAFADPDIGCGFGTQIWTGSKGVAPKVLGATTNGTLGNQTFGISSGTLGCRQGGTVTADAKVRIFTSANLESLARDMAQGRGETLDAFATLLGIRQGDKNAFFSFTQSHFAELYAGDAVTAGEVLASLERIMATDGRFAAYLTRG
ncbi:MAG: hypothetical protein DCC71_09490 [Proteobacteria bacterium]|nr:MAG: hypothetical protein DCC71_09490 [Pseudomonadota bacterium]